MITKENVTVYQCEHCKKKLFKDYAMIKHEKYCGANPENFTVCSDCDHMERREIEYFFDTYEGQQSDKSNGFYCNCLKTYIYPVFIEHRTFFIQNPEQFEDQIPFKKQCEDFTLNGVVRGLKGNVI